MKYDNPIKGTILIIEDDVAIRESVSLLLKNDGFSTIEARSGEEGMILFSTEVTLVILDIQMPGLSGFDVCKAIRSASNIPILFLTARSSEEDKIQGLNAGGDDYIVKPFSYAELLARINAILRRHQIYDQRKASAPEQDKWIEIDTCHLKIHTIHNSVFIKGREIILTETEYQILLLFAQHPGEVFSIANVYEAVWGEPFISGSANTVMVHIRNLRGKIEEKPSQSKILVTVWGKGYRLST